MEESISFPLSRESLREVGGTAGLAERVRALGCSGIEAIWGGDDAAETLPPGLAVGYHLLFYPNWVDFWRGDEARLLREFGSREMVRSFYGGEDRDCLLRQYREDLRRAERLQVRYVVFHVSDVSIREGYTYRWEHTDEEVLDAAAELINQLTAERDYPFEILLENQWWPGLTLTDPAKTARLLERVETPRKGLLLDTGHLMNTNLALETQAEGVDYIVEQLRRHGELRRWVRGVHLHHSLSGAYVRAYLENPPAEEPGDYLERYARSYAHILRIDQHLPWTDPAIRRLFDVIRPAYLTHELQAATWEARGAAVARQRQTLGRSGPTER